MAEEVDKPVDAKIVMAAATIAGSSALSATIIFRDNFSIYHLMAADTFASQLALHEAAHQDAGWGTHFELSRSLASAAIIMAFSAIEAAMDEALDDLKVPAELSAVMEKASVLDEVQAILAYLKAPIFDKGAAPYQPAELLRKIRNGLVHAKAEWSDGRPMQRKLSRLIVDSQLKLSPFATEVEYAFPRGCMSADVAHWAAGTARTLIKEFRERAGLPTKGL